MSTNRDEQILPIPSDLYTEVGQVENRIEELRRDVRRLRNRYAELRESPESLRTDSLGRLIEPRQAVEEAYRGLDDAEFNLEYSAEASRWARNHASRLSLTDAAVEHREQLLAEQCPPIERTR
ncbi:hypothetical protein KHQ06_08080 [Nocardia tengchongensis]|uniref:Uncharacterized protein n=1 Tax=Nocardia tengchongensis TaxID=2055889 RepID=A0ABX8CSL2_9NOCA|nr:hypothetical protein [Nocardia tengchongensis]QVI22910.1 hypothetical protein KHQ06_08080 [Nocardia tengchongensis]